MCLTCYQNLDIKQIIDQLKKLENIDSSENFGKWNTTSLNFLQVMLNDKRLEHYHYIIINIYKVINKDKKNILTAINKNSLDNSAFDCFNLIENIISSNAHLFSLFKNKM